MHVKSIEISIDTRIYIVIGWIKINKSGLKIRKFRGKREKHFKTRHEGSNTNHVRSKSGQIFKKKINFTVHSYCQESRAPWTLFQIPGITKIASPIEIL